MIASFAAPFTEDLGRVGERLLGELEAPDRSLLAVADRDQHHTVSEHPPRARVGLGGVVGDRVELLARLALNDELAEEEPATLVGEPVDCANLVVECELQAALVVKIVAARRPVATSQQSTCVPKASNTPASSVPSGENASPWHLSSKWLSCLAMVASPTCLPLETS